MKNDVKQSNKNIVLYLMLIVGLWTFCFVTLKLILMPYSIAYMQSGKMTVGYFCYAAIGLIFSTPAPFISVLIITLFKERIGLKKLFRWIFKTGNKLQTIIYRIIWLGLSVALWIWADRKEKNDIRNRKTDFASVG